MVLSAAVGVDAVQLTEYNDQVRHRRQVGLAPRRLTTTMATNAKAEVLSPGDYVIERVNFDNNIQLDRTLI